MIAIGDLDFSASRCAPDSAGCLEPVVSADIINFQRERAACRPTSANLSNPARGLAVRIYRPAQNVMQSAGGRDKTWVLEFEPKFSPTRESLMGWTGSRDTTRHIRLHFPNRERAVAFAERQGWPYTVLEPHNLRNRRRWDPNMFWWRHPAYLGTANARRTERR